MTLTEMALDEMTLDEMTLYKMTLYLMTLDKMTLDEMTLDKMLHCQKKMERILKIRKIIGVQRSTHSRVCTSKIFTDVINSVT